MAARPLPDASTPLLAEDGQSMNPIWFAYFQTRQTLSSLPDVSTTAPTNGQVLLWTAATKLWTPGAN